MPVDPVSRGRNRLMLYRIERDWYRLADVIEQGKSAADNARKELRESLMSTVAIFGQRPFFMSEEFSLMDCAVAPLLWRLPSYDIELPSQGKPMLKYAESVFERPAFRASLSAAEKEMRAEA